MGCIWDTPERATETPLHASRLTLAHRALARRWMSPRDLNYIVGACRLCKPENTEPRGIKEPCPEWTSPRPNLSL